MPVLGLGTEETNAINSHVSGRNLRTCSYGWTSISLSFQKQIGLRVSCWQTKPNIGWEQHTYNSCELYQDGAGERIKAVYVRRSLTFVRNIFSCPLLSDSHRFSSLGLIHSHPDLVAEIDDEPSALSQLFNCGCVEWRLMTMKLGCHHHKHNRVTIGNRNRWRQFTFFTWDGHVW